ncbi:MAG TPA: thiamine-phosphate kinase [Arenicellales bacterium]|nr:thiamine-phosphate kinase [Arenicellales bacterium]
MDEFGIIDRYFRNQRVARDDVPLGIGDDAAVVGAAGDRPLAVTTDVLVNGVHFPEGTDPTTVGHKALAVNLSDIAAMGAEPAWATLGLTMEQVDESWLEAFCEGFFALAEQHNVQLVGGDLTRGAMTIAVQLIGLCGAGGWLTRAGAREGDLIYVSGSLGDAALALQLAAGMIVAPEPDRLRFDSRLQRPEPRIALGQAILPWATAAIDISDGLVADLGHICESSGVGAEVDVARVPVSDAYRRRLSQVGWEPALTFGDDYELCFTVPPEAAAEMEHSCVGLAPAITRIGRIGGQSLQLTYNDQPFSVHEQGYQHFR